MTPCLADLTMWAPVTVATALTTTSAALSAGTAAAVAVCVTVALLATVVGASTAIVATTMLATAAMRWATTSAPGDVERAATTAAAVTLLSRGVRRGGVSVGLSVLHLDRLTRKQHGVKFRERHGGVGGTKDGERLLKCLELGSEANDDVVDQFIVGDGGARHCHGVGKPLHLAVVVRADMSFFFNVVSWRRI